LSKIGAEWKSEVLDCGDAKWFVSREESNALQRQVRVSDEYKSPAALGIWLSCVNLEGHDKDLSMRDWARCAHYEIEVSNPEHPRLFDRKETHRRFVIGSSNWGWSHFVYQSDISRGKFGTSTGTFKVNLTLRVVKDDTEMLWRHDWRFWDSRKATGYQGLINQGATCYMNSLLQSLFFTNAYRKATFCIPTDKDDATNSIALALQRLFYNLQYSPHAVGTSELTKSFGWTEADSFLQHDVQELCVILQDMLEKKMKGTPAEGSIAKLFQGKMKSYIKCINVEFESAREEPFADIQLPVKGLSNLEQSFRDYTTEEVMDGDNKYHAEGHGLQDAKKGIIFKSFPPVLHLQLKRFIYDFDQDMTVKVNDYFEYPDRVDLSPFLSEDAEQGDWHYRLHGVLIHGGQGHNGHYYAFIKPKKDGDWFRFDDDTVVPASPQQVFNEHFGNPVDSNYRNTFNAYYLVYIRETMLDEVLCDVTDIPAHIGEQLEVERRQHEAALEEKRNAHMYCDVAVITEKDLRDFHDWDLGVKIPNVCTLPNVKVVKMPKTKLIGQVIQEFAPGVEDVSAWAYGTRENATFRPNDILDVHLSLEVIIRMGHYRAPLFVYLHTTRHPMHGATLFFKHFDPTQPPYLTFVGTTVTQNLHVQYRDLISGAKKLMNITEDVELYEELGLKQPLTVCEATATLKEEDAMPFGDVYWVVKKDACKAYVLFAVKLIL
jgi:ubiquitin carboxyl-terminal hydrolase 7